MTIGRATDRHYRSPLTEDDRCLFWTIRVIVLWWFLTFKQGLEVVVKGLGFADIIQWNGCGFGGNA